jgi:predicted transglutaminase-like cysteine proteinase
MPAVILDQPHWAQLEQVQTQVDRQVAYVTDMERFGVPDWWEPAVDRGDCEDIVLAKRKRLVEMGWPADLLRIAVVIDGRGQLHALLTVDVTTPAGKPATYVLDSHFEHVEPWTRLNAYGYRWLERSMPGSSQWRRLDSGAPIETLQIAILAATLMPASPRWEDDGGRSAGNRAVASVQPALKDNGLASTVVGRPVLDHDAGRPDLTVVPDADAASASRAPAAGDGHQARG